VIVFNFVDPKFRPGLQQRPDYFALIIDRAGFEIDLAFNVGDVNLGGFTEGCITGVLADIQNSISPRASALSSAG
jgi:hypothetical protein